MVCLVQTHRTPPRTLKTNVPSQGKRKKSSSKPQGPKKVSSSVVSTRLKSCSPPPSPSVSMLMGIVWLTDVSCAARTTRDDLHLPLLQPRKGHPDQTGQKGRGRQSPLQGLRTTVPDRNQLPLRRRRRLLGLDRRLRERRPRGRGPGCRGSKVQQLRHRAYGCWRWCSCGKD